MTSEECRARREILNLTRAELAQAAGVPLWFVDALEDGAADSVFKAALEEGGILAAIKDIPIDLLLTIVSGLESPSASVMPGCGAANSPRNPAT